MDDSMKVTSIFIVLLAFLGTCSGQVTKSFPCPANQAVFTIHHQIGNVFTCEQTWVTHNSTIAIYSPDNPQCAVPCVNVSHGGITLSECVSIVLTITCDDSHMLTERRITFTGKNDSSSPVQDLSESTNNRTDHPESTNNRIGLIVTMVTCCLIAVVLICWFGVIRRCQEPNSGQTSV